MFETQHIETQNYEGAAAIAETSDRKRELNSIRDFRIEFGPSRKDILSFTNQIAVMVRAGMSITDSLGAIAEQQQNRKFK
ncbi:MAG: hypothetical protein DRP62_04895, partial [Planctomycetota bacterium]